MVCCGKIISFTLTMSSCVLKLSMSTYSRRHKNSDVSVPLRSVETECELCRLPFYHLHTTVAFPFCFRSIPFGPGHSLSC